MKRILACEPVLLIAVVTAVLNLAVAAGFGSVGIAEGITGLLIAIAAVTARSRVSPVPTNLDIE